VDNDSKFYSIAKQEDLVIFTTSRWT